MKITLDFNAEQTNVFLTFMQTGLASLQSQLAALTSAMSEIKVDGSNDDGSINNIQSYINTIITPQQIVVSEILDAINEAEKPKPMIISNHNNKIY